MDKSCQPLRKVTKCYRMRELSRMYTYGLNNRYGIEHETENTYINVAKKISSLPRKHNKINHGSLHKGFCKCWPQEFNSKFNTKLDTNIWDVPNFIQTSLSSMEKSHLISKYPPIKVLSEILKNKSFDFIFDQYYLQAIYFIESKIYKPCVVSFLITKVSRLKTLQEF